MSLPDMDVITTGASGAAGGGALGWLLSHLKHKETKEAIDQRVHEKVCSSDRQAITRRFDDFAARQDRMETKIDKLLEHSIRHREADICK